MNDLYTGCDMKLTKFPTSPEGANQKRRDSKTRIPRIISPFPLLVHRIHMVFVPNARGKHAHPSKKVQFPDVGWQSQVKHPRCETRSTNGRICSEPTSRCTLAEETRARVPFRSFSLFLSVPLFLYVAISPPLVPFRVRAVHGFRRLSQYWACNAARFRVFSSRYGRRMQKVPLRASRNLIQSYVGNSDVAVFSHHERHSRILHVVDVVFCFQGDK